jgi:glycosyltransferase involved in cell wall biosynthesis
MEQFAYRLSEHLRHEAEVTTLTNTRGKRALPLFLPYACGAAIRAVRREGIDIVHLADALLAPVGVLVKKIAGVPVTVSVHGLDITYPNRAYQLAVLPALSGLDGAIANSEATAAIFRERVPKSEVRVAPLGVNRLPPASESAIRELTSMLRVTAGRPLVLTVGRLVERKGVAWFVRHVLPDLPEQVVYAVAGTGPQRDAIMAAALDAGVAERLRLLGGVSADLLAAAYARADMFVMPNVPVAGDTEGFGLVALEAAASGLPVVAARLEGITDALRGGYNGRLVPPGDAAAYVAEITSLLGLSDHERRAIGARAARFTRENFGWERTADVHVQAMRSALSN